LSVHKWAVVRLFGTDLLTVGIDLDG
jgi:hypothetical protein